MLFNSWEYILFFLPLAFFGYFFLARRRLVAAAKAWLVAASLFFYSYWNPAYLPLILASMLFNYALGTALGRGEARGISRKGLLAGGILLNLGLLGYFKYTDFFLENLNLLLDDPLPLPHLLLPLAISFFTFQQIAYLVDSYRGETREYDLLNYALFVTFFPQLIAGPIVHHKEMMPQFAAVKNLARRYRNIAAGLFLFALGLFKKVVIADTFAGWADQGFNADHALTAVQAWTASLSYTFQLYFDFSGYTDMALGAALLFNIRLPINFNAPYKALSIQDFWRRWHITLSRFLRDYVYIPLGGSRKGGFRTGTNLMATFVLGGIWHGAGWTFLFWGFLHGLAMVAHRAWQPAKRGLRRRLLGSEERNFGIMGTLLAWFATFQFINVTWVFFRAERWEDALRVLEGMASPLARLGEVPLFQAAGLVLAFALVLLPKKSAHTLALELRPAWPYVAAIALIALAVFLRSGRSSSFLYFNF